MYTGHDFIVLRSMQSLHRLTNNTTFYVHFQITTKCKVILCIICSCWLHCSFGMIKCIIFCAEMYILMAINCFQAANVLYRQLMYHIAVYLICNGILYIVLKINFYKGLHVKVKHSTVSTKHSTNISSSFHCLFVELNWRNWMRDLWALECFTTSKRSIDGRHLSVFS